MIEFESTSHLNRIQFYYGVSCKPCKAELIFRLIINLFFDLLLILSESLSVALPVACSSSPLLLLLFLSYLIDVINVLLLLLLIVLLPKYLIEPEYKREEVEQTYNKQQQV